jgi:hypothetical protein
MQKTQYNDLENLKIHTSVYLTSADLDRVRKLAEAEDLTVSDIIRRATKRYLAEIEQK